MTLPVRASVVVAGAVPGADADAAAGAVFPASGVVLGVVVAAAAVAGADADDRATATPATTGPARTTLATAPARTTARRRAPPEPVPPPVDASTWPFSGDVIISSSCPGAAQ